MILFIFLAVIKSLAGFCPVFLTTLVYSIFMENTFNNNNNFSLCVHAIILVTLNIPKIVIFFRFLLLSTLT